MRIAQKHGGFTLIEVMVVVMILGILAFVAVSSYGTSSDKGRRGDGQSSLMNAASKMEAYFYTNKTYSTDMTDMGYDSNPATSPEGYYSISVNAPTAACPITSCYELQATALGVQIEDGDLTLESAGRKLPADKW